MRTDPDACSRSPQPNTCEKAAIETASVIISMMIASSFMKSSAISFIDPVPSLLLILRLSHPFSNGRADEGARPHASSLNSLSGDSVKT